MSPLIHSLATLWSRFRWEILGFLLLVIASALADLGILGWSGVLTALKSLAFFWLTLRIALSETGFKTHGGWQTRPFNPRSVLIAQLLLLLVLSAVMLLLRAFVLQQLFHPTGSQWRDIMKSSFTAEVLPWFVFLICLKGFAFLLLRPLEGRARKAVWAAMIIVLVPCALLVATVSRGRFSSQGGNHNMEALSQGIQRQLPDATEFVGMWREHLSNSEVPSSRLLARIPIDKKQNPEAPGLRVVSLETVRTNYRVQLTLELLALDPALFARLGDATPVLAYRGGYYGSSTTYNLRQSPSRGLITRTPSLSYQLSFASPLSFPEFQEAEPADFAPTELLFFVPSPPYEPATLNFPSMATSEVKLNPPLAIPPPETGQPFADAVRELIDSCSDPYSPPEESVIRLLRSSLPPEAIDPILAYHPWPDYSWERVVLPILTKSANESHKPALLSRLAHDPRLTTLFIGKNWTADAIPVLRQRAIERLPLPSEAIALLAKQSDPELADDLAALAIRLNRGIEKLAPVLRQSAGFDWSTFVANGWRSRKYGDYRYEREGWLYALWAAELGDRSALRRLAEEATVGKKWEHEQLAKLIPTAPNDLIRFLRENLTKLTYDAETQTWQLN